MSSAAGTVENASIISENVAHDGNRLWIGNIDPKITEWVHYQVSVWPAFSPSYLWKMLPSAFYFCYFADFDFILSVLLLGKQSKLVGHMYVSAEIGAETTCETF